MVSEAINGEILSEVHGAMKDISIEVGNLNKYIGTIGDVMSDEDLRNVRGYYQTIKDQIGMNEKVQLFPPQNKQKHLSKCVLCFVRLHFSQVQPGPRDCKKEGGEHGVFLHWCPDDPSSCCCHNQLFSQKQNG